jgi:CRP-like cAMP-binding protein
MALAGMKTRTLAAGETLLREGDPPGDAYIVEAGLLHVFKRQPGGSEVLMAELGPGSIVGEMSLLTLEPRAASVVAGGETRVFVISTPVFAALLRLSASFAVKIARLSEGRRRELARV